jgi:hypothetical protein
MCTAKLGYNSEFEGTKEKTLLSQILSTHVILILQNICVTILV